MNDTQKMGKIGEIEAARFLRKNGYQIVSANFRTHYGEIDLVAQKGNVFVFVEVKTRNTETPNSPSFSVDAAKQRKVTLSAEQFMANFNGDYSIRFDIIEVIIPSIEMPVTAKINHIKDAFTPGRK